MQDFELHTWHFILCLRFKIRLIAFHIKNDKEKNLLVYLNKLSQMHKLRSA